MSLLILICVVLVILALAIYAVRLAPLSQPFSNLIQALLVVIAIIYLINRAGLL